MKVCPKCNSSYTDETLNFCLTDGVPLVAEEILDEYLSKHNSKSWHTADTLVDSRFAVGGRATAVNPSSPTLEMGNNTASSLTLGQSRFGLYAILAVLLIAAVGGFLWWSSRSSAPAANKSVLSPETASQPKHAVIPISPEEQAQVKKEVTDFMQSWAKTNSEKNSDAHLAHYANVLEIYYGESGKDKNHVLADRLRAYQRYDSIQMQVDNLQVTPQSTESAIVVFDKSWTMKNDKKTSTGSVQQEVHLTKTNGRWLIDSEKDLKVYFINNRENQAQDGANSNAAN